MPTQKPVRLIRSYQPITEWFHQLIERRETLWFFVLKDLKVQYQNPVLGLIWSVLQPMLYFGIILTVINFSGRETNVEELPFSLFLICGLTIWNFTTASVTGAVNGIQSNAGIISKSFFPKIYLVLAPLAKQIVDFTILAMLIIGLSVYLQHLPSLKLIALIIVSLLITFFTAFGLAAIAASLTVKNRHIRHLIPILLYAMMFALPVFYSVQQINNSAVQTLYNLNPIAGAMDCLRAGFSNNQISFSKTALWLIQSLIWATIGVVVFRKTEQTLADKV